MILGEPTVVITIYCRKRSLSCRIF